ncbi:hypothetical protein Taro_016714 [Colocasia esculenta]|uniref:Importin-9 central HEAT repeats domain-containing protein n=1 Tax=Colocasia esculenta TaxID=4460 RepID=A0A843UPI5_COLES|nr:hypothetical protein [Colocasia esculenta]
MRGRTKACLFVLSYLPPDRPIGEQERSSAREGERAPQRQLRIHQARTGVRCLLAPFPTYKAKLFKSPITASSPQLHPIIFCSKTLAPPLHLFISPSSPLYALACLRQLCLLAQSEPLTVRSECHCMAAAASVDQDQQWLLSCLTATLDTNHDVRNFAEASLQQASLQPVLLKQFIKQHWKEDEEGSVHPVVLPAEKASIRQFLLFSLDDPQGKIRTAIGMAMASIAHYDWPDDWPDLLPFLLKLISDESNIGGVRGALRCLALLSDDLDDTVVPKLVPILFPQLHRIVSSPNCYEKALRDKALSIVHSCISVLGSMSGVFKTETRALLMPMLKPWMEQFAIILQPQVCSEDPDDWSIRMEPLWQTFVSCLKVYQLSLIQGIEDPYSGRFDSDGVEKSLESFVIQLFELLLTVVGNSRLSKIVGSNVKELVFYSMSFLQMTEEQVHAWSTDANLYVADEDDVNYSCRVSGSLLLEEIINAYGREGIDSVIEAAQKHYNESCQAKLTGSSDWWRIREASIFALCSVSDQLIEAEDSGFTKFNLSGLLHQMLTEDIGSGLNEFPFLHARAFSAVAKFFSLISQELRQQFLYAASQAIAMDVPPPVKVGACRALSQLLPESDPGNLQPHLMRLFSSLIDLLKQASEETLHLVLETLQAAVRAGHEHTAPLEPVISPIILNTWVQHVSDPFISIDAVEVLERKEGGRRKPTPLKWTGQTRFDLVRPRPGLLQYWPTTITGRCTRAVIAPPALEIHLCSDSRVVCAVVIVSTNASQSVAHALRQFIQFRINLGNLLHMCHMNFSFLALLPNEKPTKIILDEENQNNYISQAIVNILLQTGEIIVDGDQAFLEFHLKILGKIKKKSVNYFDGAWCTIDPSRSYIILAIKKAPGCLQPLVSRILPYIGSVLEKPQLQPTGLVAGSLDLLTMLLKNAPADIVKVMFYHCFNSVICIILRSDDHGEMQNATQCLAAFVLGAKQELLAWGGDPGMTMKSLLDAASRLLDPDLESSGSLFVGSYVLQLILHVPSQMALHIRELIGCLVRRMQSCEIEGLKSSLIVIIARLVILLEYLHIDPVIFNFSAINFCQSLYLNLKIFSPELLQIFSPFNK